MITRRFGLRGLRTRPLPGPLSRLPPRSYRPHIRSYTSAPTYMQDVFHAQADDPKTSTFLASRQSDPKSGQAQTLTEKIVQKYAVDLPPGKFVKAGDYVTIRPHHCMTHDNSWPVATKFMSIGASKIHDPKQVVITLDHDVQNKSETNLKKYKQIEEFAKKQNVDFFPAGSGIGHQIMVEEGYAWPGTMTVASDSHSNMYGGVGSLGTAVVRTDAASIWATGKTWWQVPPVAKVTFTGTLPPGVTGKDVIVALCGLFNNDEVLNHAIEFTGSPETMQSLAIDDRLAIANMTTEWGALTGLFPIDHVLIRYLTFKSTLSNMYSESSSARINHPRISSLLKDLPRADSAATYAKSLFLNLSTLQPYVSGPNSVKNANPLSKLQAQHIKINKAYLVSCTNSRASDLAAAAKAIKEAGPKAKVSPGVEFYIAAASQREQAQAEESGDWQVLLDAGAKPLPSGCGPCIGLGTGLLEPGEVGISASNRNFKGRMGSTEAQAYLSSPEVVAASALAGEISGPGWYEPPASGAPKVILGEGNGNVEEDKATDVDAALNKLIADADAIVAQMQRRFPSRPSSAPSTQNEVEPSDEKGAQEETLTTIHPNFPSAIKGEILFCDSDNINTDGIYPGKYTYQDNISPSTMSEVCMSNYDPSFNSIAKEGDILVSGFNFGCGSSREQAATAILAKGIKMVVAGSFGGIFMRNSVNNALLGVEVPKLVERLREAFSSSSSSSTSSTSSTTSPKAEITEPENNKESLDTPKPAEQQIGGSASSSKVKGVSGKKLLTQRTGWIFEWDVRTSKVTINEGSREAGQGKGGDKEPKVWSQKVGELPPNVQEIIARGGLEGWVRGELESERERGRM